MKRPPGRASVGSGGKRCGTGTRVSDRYTDAVNYDQLAMMTQLGLDPTPAEETTSPEAPGPFPIRNASDFMRFVQQTYRKDDGGSR
jgi:hypothetical protein